ncbi:hypothetical protein [Burkholderia sp. Bp8986]|nr:hypothetical protein [Burkholderia sp. Bp8986]
MTRASIRLGTTGQVSQRFSISASFRVEGNLSDYSVATGQFTAKYRCW